MSLRGMRLILQAAFCSVLMAGSASALTLVEGLTPGDTNQLDINTQYVTAVEVANNPAASALAFSHVFFFNPSTLISNTASDITANFVIGSGFDSPLTLEWVQDLGAPGLLGGETILNTLALTATQQTALLVLTAGTNYYLRVSGSVKANKTGTYGFALTTTPIPPAVLLFGSALAGLGFLGRRSRRRAAPSPLA